MSLKLYKQEETKTLYWITWENEGIYIVQTGILGETGTVQTVKGTLLRRASKKIANEINNMRQNGYREIDDLKTVIIQYKIDGFGNQKDLDKRYEVEFLMNECLGWTGVGHCDGGDIGSDSMNIFCFVVDVDLASTIIRDSLTEKDLISGAVIIAEEDEELRILWPLDYNGEIISNI